LLKANPLNKTAKLGLGLTLYELYDIIFVLNIRPSSFMQETVFSIIQLVLAILLTVVILLQQKGSGLSGVFGGSSNIYSTKRGIDKTLHFVTIGIAIVFFAISLVRLVL